MDFNFGTKSHPIENIYFYSKASPDKGIHISPDKVIVKCSIFFMVTTLSHNLMSRNTFKTGNSSFLQQRLQQLLQAAQVIIWPGQRLKKTINSTHRLHQLRPDTISDYYKNSQSQTLNILLGRSKIRMVTEYYNSNVSSPKMRKFINTLFNHSQSFTLRTNKTKSLRMSSNATVQFECSWEIQWTGYLTYCSVV